jgi:hypothetical protein
VGGCGIRYGFSQGGFPSNIKTMAIMPFENETASPDVTKELYDEMHHELQRRLGVRDAPQERANAIVRGKVTAYDSDVPVGFSANPSQALTVRRQVQVTIDITIVDQSNGRVLLQTNGMREQAEYAERAEAEGRRAAIKKLVNSVIEKAQSQW